MPPSANGVRCGLRRAQEPNPLRQEVTGSPAGLRPQWRQSAGLGLSGMVTADVSDALWTPRYVVVEAGGGVIGDDDHGDRGWRTCDLGRFSPGELVTLRVGMVNLRAAKIWFICAAHQGKPR